MDGRKRMLAAVMGAGVMLWCAAARGQAMGQVSVEDGSTGAPVGVLGGIPAVAPPAIKPATVSVIASSPPAAAADSVASTPRVIGNPGLSDPPEIPAGPLVPAAGGAKPQTAGVTSLPTEGGTAPAAETSAIEQAPIRKSAAPSGGGAATSSSSGSSLLPPGVTGTGQVIAALAVVIGLIFVGKGLAKKYVPGAKTTGPKGVVEILSKHPLSKNQTLVLVRIGSQVVAINQGRDQSQSLLVISEPTEVARLIGHAESAGPKSISTGFNRLLANAAVDLRDSRNDPDGDSASDVNGSSGRGDIPEESLEDQLEEMAAARRQLMDLRTQVRSVREKMPRA